jgi:biopolymer transport protein ExbD
MRSQRHVGEDIEGTGIDLAPMLDFVLNLLIFFIIVTSFVRETGTEVVRAEARTVEHVEKGNILIAIRPTGEIWMDRSQVDLRDIRPMIERFHVERPEDSVVVVADKASKTGILAKVMDEVRLGGIKAVSLAAAEPGGR